MIEGEEEGRGSSRPLDGSSSPRPRRRRLRGARARGRSDGAARPKFDPAMFPLVLSAFIRRKQGVIFILLTQIRSPLVPTSFRTPAGTAG